MRKALTVSCGVLLMCGAVWGLVHSVRASVAQAMYYQAKYGAAREYPKAVFRRAELSHRLYPYNYYLCIWTSELAYYSSFELEDEAEREEMLRVAQHWCNTGLALNPYKSQLRLLKARLLARESPAGALAYWEEYVDWHFWDAFNHAMIVEFAAAAGDFERALDAMRWVKGSPHEAHARARLDEAWKREMQAPPG